MVCYVESTVLADGDSIPAEHTVARSEIDNHADMTCFGSNFVLIYFMRQVVFHRRVQANA